MPVPIHTPADVIRTLLINFGIGGDPTATPLPSWPCYKASEPNTPDNLIVVYDDTNSDDGRLMGTGELMQMAGIQFRVRSADDTTGYLKVQEIERRMSQEPYDEVVAMDSANYRVHSLDRWGSIMRHGKELPPSKRHVFTITCLSLITRIG